MTEPRESEAAEALRAHLAALRARDLEALRATVSAALAERLDAPGFAAHLEVMSHLVPDDYTVAGFADEGESGSLEVETEWQTARFELVREGGAWKVAGQTWSAKDPTAPS